VKQIRQRLTYANVMSSIAVFLVLGGATAFAASKIGANQIKANSIKTGKIVKEAVTAGKIKKGAVTESRIGDGAVTTSKIADNAVTTSKIATDAVTGDKVKESTLGTVPDASTLGGTPANSFQQKGDLLFATVAPANAAAAIVRGRGATSVTRIATGFYAVTFERDITGCTWLATYGQPNNAGVDALWATVRGRTNANELGVVLWDDAGAQADGNGFHVEVLCP
jgi:hypothetical protein